MTAAEWRRVQEIADGVLDLPAEERAGAIEAACGGDAVLLQRVNRIVDGYSETEDLGGLTTETLPAPSRTGQMAGNYRLLHPIGEGGMGTVYLAERADEAFAKLVAVKLTAPNAHFVREREILARLEHAHIARLLDAGSLEDGSLYMVMEQVEGARPLTEYARGLALDERLRLFVDACEAVQYAHQHAVIHCDLKPSNLLVNAAGELKVVDFGIASPEGTANSGLSSLGFSSPEQAAGQATALSDVYSLGVTLRHLIGQEAELRAIVARATQPDPALRYESAAALGRDVKAYRERRPVRAYGKGAFYVARKWAGRHPWQALALGLAVCLVMGALAVALQQWDRASARTALLRQMARKLVLKDLPALQNQPNSTAIRATLMAEMESTLRLLYSEVGSDVELQIELAGAYHQAARLKYGDPDGSMVLYSAALADLGRAQELYRKAVKQRPGDVPLRARMLRAGLDEAYTLLKVGKLAEAGRVARGVEAEIQVLQESFRQVAVVRRTTATAYHALGNIAVESGQLRAGMEYRKKGLEVYARELSGEPGKEPSAAWLDQDNFFRDHVSNLYAAAASTGSVYLGYSPEIEADARKALAILEPCHTRANCATRIMETNTVLAKILYSSGRRGEARALLKRNVEEIRAWSARDEGNGRLKEIEEESGFALLHCLLAEGALAEAIPQLERLGKLREQLRGADGRNPRQQESELTLALLDARVNDAAIERGMADLKLKPLLVAMAPQKDSPPQLNEAKWAIVAAAADYADRARAVGLREEALGIAEELMRNGAERAAPLWAASVVSYARSVLLAPTAGRRAKARGLLEKCREGVTSDYPVMRGKAWVTPPGAGEVEELLGRLR
jgi:ElaB/YqjD/DUF883 family membrane-anchored ribosome-binding protein